MVDLKYLDQEPFSKLVVTDIELLNIQMGK